MHDETKYDLAISISIVILSKLVADQHQLIIKGKIQKEAWNVLQERFQQINLMSTSHLIPKATTKKLLDCKNVHKFTSSY